jgi:predicted transcriptional regulator
MLSPEQCRAARAWLGWPQDELAKRAKVGLSTLKDFEGGKRAPMRNNLEAIRTALENAGIRFIYADDGELAGIAGALAHQGEGHGTAP